MMSEKQSRKALKGESSRLPGNVERAAGEVSNTTSEVTRQINKAVEAVGTTVESIAGALQGIRRLRGVGAKPEYLANIPLDQADLDQADLDWLDLIVESRLRDSRSKAAAFLIKEGVKARQESLDGLAERIGRTPPGKV